ncbi:SH3 domain-containing protein [Allosediminivita pacifica]|uniref:SH3 domain-containing protein n=2 Tax=Allosediminivita pacifica TaxID=1267769 RepID=A0A2T6AS62_9RHOB|nr:SH3 domain-containing protein [Allosediminivita pacifica]PTX46663.1 SH3 domain-containing protein [Allosediminivita pacifica]GGB15885.1 hypothetical protein GCM10011324_27620 [Allosediminivita pacifica]
MLLRLTSVTLIVLGMSWYELSGGEDFEPGDTGVTLVAVPDSARPAPDTRVASAEAPAEPQDRSPAAHLVQASAELASGLRSPIISTANAAPAEAQAAVPQATVQKASLETTTPAAAPEPELHQVTGTVVNLRMGPGTDFNVAGQLREGTRVRVLREMEGGSWVKLRAVDEGRIGYMSARFVAPAG